jgi:N-acetylneuraminic acid mutarotase
MRERPDGEYSRLVRASVLLLVAACGSSAHAPDATPDASAWTAGPNLPGPRLLPSVAALGDRLIVADGFDQGLNIVTEVDALDTATGTWSRLPDAPVAWTHADLAAANGSLYLLGGLETQNFDVNGSSWVLDATATQWRALRSMDAGRARGAAGVAVRPPYIYLIGGGQQNTSVALVDAYDIATDQWVSLPDLPSPRSHPGATVLPDGTLLCVGGLVTLDSTQPLAEVWALPVNATAWQPRAPMPTARGGMACGLFGTRFVCAGGEADDTARDEVEAYDWAHDTWTSLPKLPMPRAGTQGAAIGTRLYVPGGAHRIAYVPDDTMDVLTVE